MRTGYIIEADVVVNAIILANDADPANFGAVLGPEGVGIGWAFDGETWSPPVGPALSLADLRAANERFFREWMEG